MVDKDEPEHLRFVMINEDKPQKEEDVDFLSDNEIQFRIILTEMNIERKRYLILNRY